LKNIAFSQKNLLYSPFIDFRKRNEDRTAGTDNCCLPKARYGYSRAAGNRAVAGLVDWGLSQLIDIYRLTFQK
jgi:hypothetical protein